MKPMKSNKKVSTERKSSIQDYFKTTGKQGATSVATISDVRSQYVQALKSRLKSFDHEDCYDSTKKECNRQDNDAGATALIEEQTVSVENDDVASGKTAASTTVVVDVDGTDKIECKQCLIWRDKYEELKKSYLKLCLRHSDHIMKHDDLIKVATGNGRLKYVEVVSVSSERMSNVAANSASVSTVALPTAISVTLAAKSSTSCVDASSAITESLPNVAPNSKRSNFVDAQSGASDTLLSIDNVFTENEIKHLQSLPLHKKNDSNFILQCIEYAYKNRTAELPMKTLKGTRDRYEVTEGVPTAVRRGKDPLTPEKVSRIEAIFIDRISKSKCLAGEYGERIKQTYINRLIASAIKNLSNKTKPNGVESAANVGLEI